MMGPMSDDTARRSGAGQYPDGEEYNRFVKRRQGAGRFWHAAFFTATLIGVVALIALLADIANDAFGMAAIRNEVDPESLVINFYKQEMVSAANVQTSEDDEVLAASIAQNPYAVGFFGYAYYDEHADNLNLVSIDGIAPSAETVDSGEYKLARPLFLYTAVEILAQKPQVVTFLAHYLRNVNGVIDDVGYFPLQEDTANEQITKWEVTTGASLPERSAPVEGDIVTVGSSTVAPVTQRIADDLAANGQLSGNVTVENIGTDAGLLRFCVDKAADIANASRAMINLDIAACRKSRLTPVEFRIANDGIALVVSQENTFLTDVTSEQLQQIFTTAERWSDVNAAWPDEPIARAIPGVDSGTLDFFAGTTFGTELNGQPAEVLQGILLANVSTGRARALEAQKPLAERSYEELVELVETEVLKPEVVKTWPLLDSVINRSEIEAEAATLQGNVELVFRSWVNRSFITNSQSSDPLKAGIATAIFGSLWVTLLAFLFAIPLGVAAAIYLEEYNTGQSRLDQLIETNINNLAGVPSIIYGMLGLAVFVRIMGPLTSGVLFGVADPTTANGRTILSAGLTLAVLILPLVIINAREAIRAVPRSMREAAYGLGATRWQTTWYHVLPGALPGILTGVILSVSRAFGETAPLIVVGVSTYIVVNPNNVFSKYTTLPAQIYQWTSRPQQEFQHLAAAAIIVLLVLLVTLNAAAIYLRNRYSRRI